MGICVVGCCINDDSLTVSIKLTSSILYDAAPLYSSIANASLISAIIIFLASCSDLASIIRESNKISLVFNLPCWYCASYLYTFPFFLVKVIPRLISAVI